MSYQGEKFETKRNKTEIEFTNEIIDLNEWCRIFSDYKLAPLYDGGSFGNMSYREKAGENQFVITGSNSDLGDMKISNFVRITDCDYDNNIVYAEGEQNPSSESLMHHAIYKQRDDINVIFHGHSKKVLSNAKRLNIPITSTEEEYGTMNLVNKVLELSDSNNMLVIKNHGFVILGDTIKSAGDLTGKLLDMLKKK